jgi:hypothetical protein
MKTNTTMKLTTLAGAVALAMSSGAFAGTTATHDVSFDIDAVNEIAIAGGNITLKVDSATAGSDLTSDVDDATATYAITTNDNSANGMKITAKINADITENDVVLNLKATGSKPTGSTQVTDGVDLSETEGDLVTGIKQTYGENFGLTYTLEASVTSPIMETAVTKTVTLTITTG